MGAGSTLGLLFEINADPSKAEAALDQFRASSVAQARTISTVWSSALNEIAGPAGGAEGPIFALSGAMREAADQTAETTYKWQDQLAGAHESLRALAPAVEDVDKAYQKYFDTLMTTTRIEDSANALHLQAQNDLRLQTDLTKGLTTAQQQADAAIAQTIPHVKAFDDALSGVWRRVTASQIPVQTANLREMRNEWNSLSQQVRTSVSEMLGAITGWGGVAVRVFDQIFNQISRQIEIERELVVEHKLTEVSMTTATLDALKQLAVVKAVEETAKGFAALGDFDFWAAAQHFASAALWGTVGAMQIASMAGAFSGGGVGAARRVAPTAAGGTAATTTVAALAPGAVGAVAGPPGGNLTVMVVGEPAAGQWLAKVLNAHVEQRGGRLVSSKALRPASAGV